MKNKKEFVINQEDLLTVKTASDKYDSYQKLCCNIDLAIKENDSKIVVITSDKEFSERCVISLNTAIVYGLMGKKVLIADMDYINNAINKILSPVNRSIKNVIYGNTQVEKLCKKTNYKNVNVLALGAKDDIVSSYLDGNKSDEVFNTLNDIYDIIIIDLPPCNIDALYLALPSLAYNFITVVKKNKSSIYNVKKIETLIKSCGKNLIGTVYADK